MTLAHLLDRSSRPGFRLTSLAPPLGAMAAFVYMVLIGGTGHGELLPPFQLANGALGGALVITYVWGLRRADRVDTAVLLAIGLFTASALLSTFPRHSFDAALAALAFAAGLFVARDLLRHDVARRALAYTMVGLSLIVTLIVATNWLPLLLEWWALTDWQLSPPLGFELPGGPWGHRHDLALLVALLYPGWWIESPSALRKVAAVLVGALSVIIVIIDGSRMLWLAIGVATVVVAGPIVFRHLPRTRRGILMLAGLILVGLALVSFAGVVGAIAQRLAGFASLEYRIAMWEPLVDAWLAHPISGIGPGSFPWILQTTAYFDTNAWTPRHPDSVLFQLMPEAGILGLLAVLAVLAALLPAVMGGRSTAARWALVVFATSGIGANPTDFAFLVVVAIAWTAYAVPHAPTPAHEAVSGSRRWPAYASLVTLALVSIAYLSSMAASFSYTGAGAAIKGGDLGAGEAGLTMAISLDPEMALYWRQRGAVRLLREDPSSAVTDLQRAVDLNPSDDLAWRTLALALADTDRSTQAAAAADRAIAVQRSDPLNLLIGARLALDAGREEAARNVLSQVVQAWPQIVTAPGWDTLLADGRIAASDVVQDAAGRARRAVPVPESNETLLRVLDEPAATVALQNGDLAVAREASYRCQPGVVAALDMVSDAERRQPAYLDLLIRESIAAGAPDGEAIRRYEILTGGSLTLGTEFGMLSPLYQHDAPVRLGSDLWGYRRLPIAFPQYDTPLPSPNVGTLRWLIDPVEAGREAGLRGCLRDRISDGD